MLAGFSLCKSLRRGLLANPLFLPLICVVTTLAGSLYGAIAVVVVMIVAALCRCYRIAVCCLLCAAVAFLHQKQHLEQLEAYVEDADYINYTERCGTVERSLENGCVFRDDECGVSVVLRGVNTQWRAGDQLKVKYELMPANPAPVKGMFNSADWLCGQGIAATAYCVDVEYLGHPFSIAAIRGFSDDARDYLARRLIPFDHADDARAQVLCAMVLGDKSHSEPETVEVFKRGGCLHIFAVSGLHVGIIAGIFYFVLGRVSIRPRFKTLLIILLTGTYVLMTGMAVPALRAFLMLSCILLGRSLKRPISMLNIWSAVALGILLFAPWQLYNVGFLLSFSVYAAIVMGVGFCMKSGAWLQPDAFLPRRIYNKRERLLVKADFWLRGLIIMSLSAWLASVPITAACFHTCNIYGVLTNIVITPLLLPTMSAGLISMVTAHIPYLGAMMHACALYCSGILLSIVGFFASLPGAYTAVAVPPSADAVMACDVGYGNAVCLLGNPGMMINCGNEKAAMFFTQPALFHTGFTPSVLLLTQRRASLSGGVEHIRATVPGIQVLWADELGCDIKEYTTDAGRYVIVPPSDDLSRSPVENQTPIVYWQGKERSVLFVGNASLHTFERLPSELLQADVVICGYNPALTITPKQIAERIPAETLLLLPDAAIFTSEDLPNKESILIQRVNEDAPLILL